jgi:hypothetical protein
VPAKLRRWLEATYPTCGREGCDNTRNLIIDHIEDYADGGILDEHNAWRLCPPATTSRPTAAGRSSAHPGAGTSSHPITPTTRIPRDLA